MKHFATRENYEKNVSQSENDIQENFTFDNFSQTKNGKKNNIKLPSINFLEKSSIGEGKRNTSQSNYDQKSLEKI